MSKFWAPPTTKWDFWKSEEAERRFALEDAFSYAYALRRMPYEHYLKTLRWRIVRERALQAAGRKCSECGTGDDLQVHHLTYARRGCEAPEDLAVMCRACHFAQHPNLAELDAWRRSGGQAISP